jgi:hypothetical protein
MDEPHHESKQLVVVVVVVVGVYIASKSVFPRKERKIEEGDRSARGLCVLCNIYRAPKIYVYKPAADQPRD